LSTDPFEQMTPPRRSGRGITIVLIALGLLFALFFAGAGYYTDYLWFKSLDLQGVFLRVLFSQLGMAAAVGLVYALFLLVNLSVAKGSFWQLQRRMVGTPWEHLFTSRGYWLLGILASLVMGLLAGAALSGQWPVILRYLHSSPFGVADPLFGLDVGFFVFSLPVLELLYQTLFGMGLVALAAVTAIYFFSGAFSFNEGGGISISPRMRAHVSALTAFLFILKALGYRLAMFNLVYSQRGAVFGAAYADVHAQLPGFYILMGIALLLAILLIVNIWLQRWRLFIGGVIALGIASVVVGSAYPTVVQQFVVSPNEFAKEQKYIEYNIQYTRLGYGLDDVVVSDFPASENLDRQDLDANYETVNNIRIWDVRPLLQTYAQLQGIRPYYVFKDVDVDRYTINGRYQQVMLAARELDPERLQERAKTWVNQRLKYTHGYGVALSPATAVTTEGLPVFLIKDIPPRSSIDLEVTEPAIYYGEVAGDYVIVRSQEEEFDYPIGERNAMTTYQGTGGVRIGSLVNKAAFALRFGSYRILLSGAVTPDSRVMMYRNIVDRVERIAPFLTYDQDPYLVINDDGKLYWILDGYTVSDRYPYSEPIGGGVNYIRNSVKVVVDAYNGSVGFYIIDEQDPLVRSYAGIFPDLFQPISELPEGLLNHLRYPEMLFRIQAQIYANFHMDDPMMFYNKEDSWSIPNEVFGDKKQPVEPYYTIMRLPDGEEAEFVLLMPFTPLQKDNMIAWFAARNDGEHYGELILYRFPKDTLVFGPAQIEARIDQDAVISQQLALWGQRGSQVIRGNLLVIPIADSLLYVEPLFLQATGNQLPELKRIIVAYGDNVIMAPTLEEALATIFGAGQGQPALPSTPGVAQPGLAQLLEQANQLYDEAQAALRAGNWALYGERVAELGRVLEELQAVVVAQ
jgi:uncharacterized membrane protein (UPF0182 family)